MQVAVLKKKKKGIHIDMRGFFFRAPHEREKEKETTHH